MGRDAVGACLLSHLGCVGQIDGEICTVARHEGGQRTVWKGGKATEEVRRVHRVHMHHEAVTVLPWWQGETSIPLEDDMAADMLVTVYEIGVISSKLMNRPGG